MERLQLKIVPFIVVLVIPLLGRMSDFVQDVREIISRTFAMLMVCARTHIHTHTRVHYTRTHTHT